MATGFPSVEATCKQIGLTFDPWQRDLNRAILGKDAAGWYAADTVGLSICRQAGKTHNVGALVFADSIKHPGTTTVWTAHKFKVARESFDVMRSWARSDAMSPHIDYDAITTAAGNEAIPFRNGSRIVFAARERGSIRGFTKVRRVVLDEAQILTESAMSDLAPTMNHAVNPQIVMMGTPPKPGDPSEVFTSLRTAALAGESEGTLWVEFGADPESDIDSQEAAAQANPSYPDRTTWRAIQRLRKLLSNDDDWCREGLGMWSHAGAMRVIPANSWLERADKKSTAVDRFGLGIEVAPDLARASVSLSGQRTDGSWHIELIERHVGVDWVASFVRSVLDLNPEIRGVAVDDKSPTSAIEAELREGGVRVMSPKAQELGQACSRTLEGLVTGQIFHTAQPQMDVAASVAGKRKLADTGLWVFARSSATADITPIQSAVLALWAAQHERPRRPLRRAGGRRVVTV